MASNSRVVVDLTFFDLLVLAAKDAFGENITVRNNIQTQNHLNIFKKSMSLKVLRREEKPTPVGRTIVDISTKEFKNHAAEDGKDPTAKDITKVTLSKSSANSTGQSFQFISTQGIVWDVDTNNGLQVLTMGMAGGSIQDSSAMRAFGSSLNSSLGFNFCQEEAVCVPPGKKVHVTITTSKVLYQLGYTLELRVPKTGAIYVTFEEPCLCDLFKVPVAKYISYSRILRNLPNYREDDNFVYFTQEGFLSWIGESCEVDKREALV